MALPVTLDIQVEDLAREHPESVGFLTKRGLRVIRCGEAVWGTLGEFLLEYKVEDTQALLNELNAFLESKE
jgi:hypothetical protein